MLEPVYKLCAFFAGGHHNPHGNGYGTELERLGINFSPQSKSLFADADKIISLVDFFDAGMSRHRIEIKEKSLQGKPLIKMMKEAYPGETKEIDFLFNSRLAKMFYSKSQT